MDEPQEQTNGETTMSTEEKIESTLEEIGIQPEPLPTRLSQGDFDLLIPAIRERLAAQENLNRAQQQFAQAQEILAATGGAVQYIFRHLKPKYQIKDGEDIDLDGVIIRKE